MGLPEILTGIAVGFIFGILFSMAVYSFYDRKSKRQYESGIKDWTYNLAIIERLCNPGCVTKELK